MEKTKTTALNGYYNEDFKDKQLIIKDLLENKEVEYDSLNLLMNGELGKFCSKCKTPNREFFWYSW